MGLNTDPVCRGGYCKHKLLIRGEERGMERRAGEREEGPSWSNEAGGQRYNLQAAMKEAKIGRE